MSAETIKKEYESLKKTSISGLRNEWSRHHRVGDPKELDKEGLISDILRARHGNKRVDAAFGIKEDKLSTFASYLVEVNRHRPGSRVRVTDKDHELYGQYVTVNRSRRSSKGILSVSPDKSLIAYEVDASTVENEFQELDRLRKQRSLTFDEADRYFDLTYGSQKGVTIWADNYWMDSNTGEVKLATERTKPSKAKVYSGDFRNPITESKGDWKKGKWQGVDVKRQMVYDWELDNIVLTMTGYYGTVGQSHPTNHNWTSWMITDKSGKVLSNKVFKTLAQAKKAAEGLIKK